jgi:hypothetical protein
MRTIDRRLRRLEDRFGPPVETEYLRELPRRIEAGLRHLVEVWGKPYIPWRPSVQVLGLTLAETILRGRETCQTDDAIASDITC